MAESQLLEQAFAYKRWSEGRLFTAIEAVDPGASSSLAFICQQLNHLTIVQDLFQARLEGDPVPHANTNSDLVPDYNNLKSRLLESNIWYSELIAGLDSNSASQNSSFTFVDNLKGSMTTTEILFHIIHHSAYHRGSIAHALDLAGTAHPADSFTIFLHQTEPQRRQ